MDNTISPTLKLLNSSTVIAISGVFRLCIAFLLAGIEPDMLAYIGFGLIIYATYTLDRSLDSEEDAINKTELTGANTHIAVIVCIIAFLLSFIIFAKENLYYAPFIPFIIGYLYSKGINVGKFNLKLKGSRGGKNIVVGLTWGGTIAIIVSNWTNNIFTEISIFLFYSTKLFINSTIYDFKDINGDIKAGIKTLPVYFGIDKVKRGMIVLCILLHILMIISFSMDFIKPGIVIIAYSFFIGIFSIYFVSSVFDKQGSGITKYLREILVDGESTMVLILRAVIL